MAQPMAQPKRRSGGIVVLIIVVLLLCLLCCCVAGFLLIRQGVISVPWDNLPSWIYSYFARISQDVGLPGGQGLPGGGPETGQPGSVGPGTGQPGWVRQGDLEPGGIYATGEGIQGPVMTVRVTNPGSTDAMATLSCGFIFAPDDSSEQRMMVIQESSASVPAGGEATLTPYVICIDAHQGAPGGSSSYSPGGMAEGQLLQLAECICQENLQLNIDPLGDLGIQFAVWETSSGQTFGEMMSGGMAGGALGDLFGPDAAQMLEVLEAPAQTWLDRCNIQLSR